MSEIKRFILSEHDVAIGLKASNKQDAIEQIANFLIKNGKVSEGYKVGMLQREDEVSTYLMNGVAIPHGTRNAMQHILQDAMFIGQFPEGVIWNDKGDRVHLVCGIASGSDAHLDVLTRLTMIIENKEIIDVLSKTKDIHEIIKTFSKDIVQPNSEKIEIKGVHKRLLFLGENGMHARPATKLASMAQSYDTTDVYIHTNKASASLKSMPSILKLNISCNTEILISAEGDQAQEAFDAIILYIENELNHEKAIEIDNTDVALYEAMDIEADSKYIEGIKASPGIAVAPVFFLKDDEFTIDKKSPHGPAEEEIERLQKAQTTAIEQLKVLKEDLLKKQLEVEADIIDGHIMIINDVPIVDMMLEYIHKDCDASYAVSEVLLQQAQVLEKLDDLVLQARAYDMKDVRIRLLRILENREQKKLPSDTPFILIAKELTPTQTASLHDSFVQGICTSLGGATSHMAILARALGIPALVGMGSDIFDLQEEQIVILDAVADRLITNPSDALVLKAKEYSKKQKAQKHKEEQEAHMEAISEDKQRVEVFCNIANVTDSSLVLEKGGEGVGLFRTEFLFVNSSKEPTEDEQYNAYSHVANVLENIPIIVRVMDIGGDKPVSWLQIPKEDNPFLGIRGIRLLLSNITIFKKQLRAIYRAALQQFENKNTVTFRIMFPMISRTVEFLKAKEIALEVQEELKAPPVQLGIMIETPASALMAEFLAKEVDFFSIGTNDLTQYTLAMDRVHPELSKEADSLHPSILRLIDTTVKGANIYNKEVGVCGNMAADPVMLTVLIALGVREVSVSPSDVASTKYLIRRLHTEQLRTLYDSIMRVGSGIEVRKICEDYFKNIIVPKLKK